MINANSKSTTSRHLRTSASWPAHAGLSCQSASEFCQFSIKTQLRRPLKIPGNETKSWSRQSSAPLTVNSSTTHHTSIILHNSLFQQFTSPANVHGMRNNTTEAVSALVDSHSKRYCLIHLGNNPPKTWLQSLILVCIKQVFSAHRDASNYIICIHY